MKTSPRLRKQLAIFVLLIPSLVACGGTLEVGIERTATPDDTATAPAAVTRTPLPTLSKSMHATISVLATQVAAQATPSEFWANAGVSPDTLVAVQTRPDSAPLQFGG